VPYPGDETQIVYVWIDAMMGARLGNATQMRTVVPAARSLVSVDTGASLAAAGNPRFAA
jgi:hypothetical protein